ncbi:MAG: NUDIX domain-containing protein [Elusimicrobia bacterium]|nr:NUDIX domain-containing protein [Elusimicrobiota bacterium]
MNYPISIKGVLLHQGGALLVRNPRDEWELPGGRIEAGEEPAAALKREFLEELGLSVSVRDPIDSYLFEVIPERRVFIVAYGCRLESEFKPRVSAEHLEHRVWPVAGLKDIRLPVCYRRSIEKWAKLTEREGP